MKSISRKIILLGDFAVGKTSTVARSVRNTFSDSYLTTVGVRVDSKAMMLGDDLQMRLVLWDIAGANTLDQLRSNYVIGAAGILLVADGTREDTVDTALDLRAQAWRLLGREIPSVLAQQVRSRQCLDHHLGTRPRIAGTTADVYRQRQAGNGRGGGVRGTGAGTAAVNAKRQRPASGAAARRDIVLPVVVTLDGEGGVVDIVGNLDAFVGAGDSLGR